MLSGLDPAHRRIAQGFIVLGAVCLLAVSGYVLTGWSLSDAIYMVTITIFGVGYGEVRPVRVCHEFVAVQLQTPQHAFAVDQVLWTAKADEGICTFWFLGHRRFFRV